MRRPYKVKLTETDIKRAIKDYFKLKRLWYFWVTQGLGCYKGIPDIFVKDSKGNMWAVEVKTMKGVLSEFQQMFLSQWEDTGMHRFSLVARSLDDVMEKIK